MSQKILIIEDEPDIRKTLEYNISERVMRLFPRLHYLKVERS